jgi:hypothetical protein
MPGPVGEQMSQLIPNTSASTKRTTTHRMNMYRTPRD